jgi:hypothetical protein
MIVSHIDYFPPKRYIYSNLNVLSIDHEISNCVLHIMDTASKMQEIELDEEQIDADMENVPGIEHDEDMLVTVCYIAECFTFGREPDLDNLDIAF